MADVLLTFGWLADGQDGVDARVLHDLAKTLSGKELTYEQALLEQLKNQNIQRVNKLEQLLRRRRDGFSSIKRFTGALLDINKDELPMFKGCSIDIFAFAFLKYAKNYDLFMEYKNQRDLQETVKLWQGEVKALEDFERLGKDLVGDYNYLKAIYLKLRAAVSRPSARDEQRTLAVLLASGPSTLKDIRTDLDLNDSLTLRILATLKKTDAIESHGEDNDVLYQITKKALPVALFLVREIIGLDYLTMTASLWEER